MEYIEIDDIISNAVVYEENFKKHNDLYSREYIFKFKDYILVKNIVYPLLDNNAVSCEIVNLSENEEEDVSPINIDKEGNYLKVFLSNNIKAVKIIMKCRKNIFPKIQEIKIIKDIHKSI